MNQQLEEQDQVTTGIQHSFQRQVKQLQQQLNGQQSQRNPRPSQSSPLLPPPPPPPQISTRQLQERISHTQSQPSLQVNHKSHSLKEWKMTFNWTDGGKAPCKMTRGAAVVNRNVAYFMDYNGMICFYNSDSKGWGMLPQCPYKRSALAVVKGQITTIGGQFYESTNKLLSLHGKWMEVFPPMPTKRNNTAAMTTKEHLIVAGGRNGSKTLQTVELMDTQTLVWSTVASLPHPYANASATICGSQFYIMLGGWRDKSFVLTCSLSELLHSTSSSPSSVWYRVADSPVYCSTCTAVNGELLAVGGCGQGDKAVATIHYYNATANSWNLVGNLPTARYQCLVAVPSTNEIIVVGGNEHFTPTDIVEITSI